MSMFYAYHKSKVVTLGPTEVSGRTLTLDTSVYASGDSLCDGYFTLPVTDDGGKMVYLSKILVLDKAAQNPALRVYLFDTAPTSTITKNGAYAPSDADLFNLIGVVDIAAGTALSANSYKDLVLAIPEALKPKGVSKNIYAVFVLTAGTPTWAASDMEINLYFEQG